MPSGPVAQLTPMSVGRNGPTSPVRWTVLPWVESNVTVAQRVRRVMVPVLATTRSSAARNSSAASR